MSEEFNCPPFPERHDIKPSWIVLTYNRHDSVSRAMLHNAETAGYPWHEVVWCDNGSTDGVRSFMREFVNPHVCILHRENLGVAKGYNRAMLMATGTHVVLTGCDMLMPKDWLRTFVNCFEQIPNTGIASMYSGPLSWVPERIRGDERIEAGIKIRPAMPIGRRMFSRDMLKKVGFLREDFGLYGHEDVEWGYRAERVCGQLKLLTYVLPDMIASHLGDEHHSDEGIDTKEYREFKSREVDDPKKKELMERCRKENWPYYNPYW